MRRLTTFALLHGAWHGAWCWERLIPELQTRGHRTVAVDLPSEDPAATFEDYADVVVAALADADDVVVVGHSLAGHTIPLVAERMPVRHLVYLAALVAEPGRSFIDQQLDGGMLNPVHLTGLAKADGGTRWVDFELARSLFYSECDDDLVAAAIARLRVQAVAPMKQVCPLDRLPSVRSTYIVCSDDQMVYPAWSRRVAVDRLGVSPVELPGGHSPFYSRPSELADVLARLV